MVSSPFPSTSTYLPVPSKAGGSMALPLISWVTLGQ